MKEQRKPVHKVKRLGKDAWDQPFFLYRNAKFFRDDSSPRNEYGRYRTDALCPFQINAYTYREMLNEIDSKITAYGEITPR